MEFGVFLVHFSMLTGQDMVDKMDVLVDCWLQLAKGLLD
jgi:hypothetical protein